MSYQHASVHAPQPRLCSNNASQWVLQHVRMTKSFVACWLRVQSVPDIDMLLYLPDLLDGMMTMLSDSHTAPLLA
jgi:hypothetical protein